MAKKFIIPIIMSLFFVILINKSSSQKDSQKMLHDITISLSSNVDTCYYSNDKIVISVKFQNNGLSLVRMNKNMVITTKDIQRMEFVKINIFHDKNLYEYAYLDGKEAMSKKVILFKKKSLEINDIISFRSLATKKKIKTISNFSATKIDNLDFGIYQLQALYIGNAKDTIYSNLITVNYLKKCHENY